MSWLILFGFIAVIAVIAVLAFEVWMFVDALKNPNLKSDERIIWCIGMLLLHPFVAIAYYFVGREKQET